MHDDLLRQAHELASFDRKRPRQVNLRRAVSSAYYALFHFLVDASCRCVIGSSHSSAPFRQVLGRAFSHGTMKEACRSFSGGVLKASVRKGLPATFSISSVIRRTADAFVTLQQIRHSADYDLTERFSRPDVLTIVQQVETVIHDLKALPASDEKTFFLACLWAWGTLGNR